MTVIMLSLMRHMYTHRMRHMYTHRIVNVSIFTASTVVFVASLWLVGGNGLDTERGVKERDGAPMT